MLLFSGRRNSDWCMTTVGSGTSTDAGSGSGSGSSSSKAGSSSNVFEALKFLVAIEFDVGRSPQSSASVKFHTVPDRRSYLQEIPTIFKILDHFFPVKKHRVTAWPTQKPKTFSTI